MKIKLVDFDGKKVCKQDVGDFVVQPGVIILNGGTRYFVFKEITETDVYVYEEVSQITLYCSTS